MKEFFKQKKNLISERIIICIMLSFAVWALLTQYQGNYIMLGLGYLAVGCVVLYLIVSLKNGSKVSIAIDQTKIEFRTLDFKKLIKKDGILSTTIVWEDVKGVAINKAFAGHLLVGFKDENKAPIIFPTSGFSNDLFSVLLDVIPSGVELTLDKKTKNKLKKMNFVGRAQEKLSSACVL